MNPSKGRAVVPLDWKQKNVLVQAEVEISSGEICLLDDLILRRDLRLKLASDLLKLGIEHLDMDTLQGPKRKLTQAITRELFEEGAAGIAYRSKYDSEICGALFEGRARLVPRGEAIPLTGSFEELEQVCREFSLTLEPGL